jgi:hypothetical protein
LEWYKEDQEIFGTQIFCSLELLALITILKVQEIVAVIATINIFSILNEISGRLFLACF